METIRKDLQLALRSLRRSPAFALATIAILALAIGMSTAMFTVYKTVLVDRLPITAQDRVVVMHPLDRSGRHLDVPYPYLQEIARDSSLFRGVAGIYHLGALPAPYTYGNSTVELDGVRVSTNLFEVLGVRPVLGRFFRPQDAELGAPLVVVLSYAAWRRHFGGDPSVVGRRLVLPYTRERAEIVGVAPAGFEYPAGADGWGPIRSDFRAQVDIVARLAPRVTIDGARAGLFALIQRVNPFESTSSGQGQLSPALEYSGVTAQSFADTVFGSSRPVLVALTLAVGLLLLIACVNIGNLMLVRLLDRTRDVAVRRALGATYGDIARLFAAETVILGTIGGTLGSLTALALLRVVHVAAPPQLPRSDLLGAVGTPLGVAAAITLVAMLLFGVLPSLIASRTHSYAALRADSRSGTEGRSRRHVRRWLVSTQIALAIVMLSGAGLLVHTLARLESVDLGYQPDHLSILWFAGSQSTLPTPERIFETGKELVLRFEAMPGVVAATPIEQGPFKGQSSYTMILAPVEQPVSERGNNPVVPFELVGADYFRTFRIPIRRGRGFTARDTKSSDKVLVINETLARRLWPDQDPLGRQLVVVGMNTTWTVIGVASDTRFRELRRLGPVAYFNWKQIAFPWWGGLIAVRTTSSLAAILPSLRTATHDVIADLVIWRAESMDELLDEPLARPRFSALLMTGFSLVALLLSAIGLYGVLSSAVRRQTRDIGVRMALGATAPDVRRLVLGDATRILGVGAAVGIIGALAAGRILASQLFGVSPIDPLSLTSATGLLLAVGLAAAYAPAHRASRIDPVETLRTE